jgi:hypothetical protein
MQTAGGIRRARWRVLHPRLQQLGRSRFVLEGISAAGERFGGRVEVSPFCVCARP